MDETLPRRGKKYREFVADGVAQGPRYDLTGGGLKRSRGFKENGEKRESFDERILGNGSFVDTLLQQDELQDKLAKSWSLPELIESVGSVLSLSTADIRRPSKKDCLQKRGAL